MLNVYHYRISSMRAIRDTWLYPQFYNNSLLLPVIGNRGHGFILPRELTNGNYFFLCRFFGSSWITVLSARSFFVKSFAFSSTTVFLIARQPSVSLICAQVDINDFGTHVSLCVERFIFPLRFGRLVAILVFDSTVPAVRLVIRCRVPAAHKSTAGLHRSRLIYFRDSFFCRNSQRPIPYSFLRA